MGSLFQVIKNAITHVFQGVQGSYAFSLLGKAFIRLRTAVMNPFQRVVRRVQQLFNANIITSKLVAPIRGGQVSGRLFYGGQVLDLQNAGIFPDPGRLCGSIYLF